MDWISYHAAILNEIDPSIIPNINELKILYKETFFN